MPIELLCGGSFGLIIYGLFLLLWSAWGSSRRDQKRLREIWKSFHPEDDENAR